MLLQKKQQKYIFDITPVPRRFLKQNIVIIVK